ncbi:MULTISPECIES: vWA domain-containing protein [unclassified Frankia]
MNDRDRLGVEGRMDRGVTKPGGVLRLTISVADPPRGRREVAVAVAVDASLSMLHPAAPDAVSKWELAQRVLERVHGLLPDGCPLVLVRFAREARVISAGRRPDRLPAVDGPTNSDADSYTNIGDALTVAGRELLAQAPDADVYRVLLITDGEANIGRWQPEQLAHIVAGLGDQGIGTDALGIGVDARDEALAEMVGVCGQMQHVWAAAEDVDRIDAIVSSLIEPVVGAAAGRGELRVLIRPGWTVEALRRIKPQRHLMKVPPPTSRGTELRLPLPAVSTGEDRPVFLLRLRAPDTPLGAHTILQARGGVVAGGRRLAVDSRADPQAAQRFRVTVEADVFPDAESSLEHEESIAEFDEEIAKRASFAHSRESVTELFRNAALWAADRGFDDLADHYNATLRALGQGVAPADAVSGARVRATRTRTRTRDLVEAGPVPGRPHGGAVSRRRLDDVLGNS